jgi:hypothetical protein
MSVSRIDPRVRHRETLAVLQPRYRAAARFALAMGDVLGIETWVKRIEWDAAGGYPQHAWGYVQFSPRPYRLGYGCDGTVDANVHLIAERMTAAIGLDYDALYRQAYPDSAADVPVGQGNAPAPELPEEDVASETILPEAPTPEVWLLVLCDLASINNHELVGVLLETLEARGVPVGRFWEAVDSPGFWRRVVDQRLSQEAAA